MNKYLTKNFVTLITLAFISLYVLLYVSASISYENSFYNPQIPESVLDSVNQQRQEMTISSIFVNNVAVSIITLIPLVGVLLFSGTMFNTGTVIGYLAYATGYTPLTYLLAITFPVGLLEILAYSLLIAESITLLYCIAQRAELKNRLLTNTWKTLIFYAILLFVGSVVEATV